MTKFPTMRQYIRCTAVAVPLMLFSAFLLFASGNVIWAIVAFFAACILFAVFPTTLADGIKPAPRNWRTATAWIRLIQSVALYSIIVWMMNRPEFRECFAIILDGSLWDWQLIAAVSIVTFCAIILGLKKAADITDQAIYDHYSADLASTPSVELSHRTGNKDAW